MKAPDRTQVRDISEWLDIATKDLAQSAKQRITQEIENHSTDALQTHLDQNQNESEESLRTHVLKELGDPDAAAAIFRKKYLTVKEEAKLHQLVTQRYKFAKPLAWCAAGLAVSLLWQLIHWRTLNFSLLLGTLGTFLFSTIPYASQVVCKRFCLKRALDRLIFLQMMGATAAGLMMFSSSWTLAGSEMEPMRTLNIVLNFYNLPASLPRLSLIAAYSVLTLWSLSCWFRIRSKALAEA
jgi:hypothetical protein